MEKNKHHLSLRFEKGGAYKKKHVYEVIANEYTNPFEPEGNPKLVHLSSGVEVSQDIARSILSLPLDRNNCTKNFETPG